jgi:hypothetical protein
MARYCEPTPEQEARWREWVTERPDAIREVAARFDPWSLYRMKSTGHRVTVYSYSHSEPITLTVHVSGEFNRIDFERMVFGIDPDDLEPCELPGPDEALGALLTQEEVEENIDALRVAIRPDLWHMGENGKAVRKS